MSSPTIRFCCASPLTVGEQAVLGCFGLYAALTAQRAFFVIG